MKKYQIFVSSTYDDLEEERDLVIKAILEMGHIPVGMEMFSAADDEQWKLIARQIQESDYYVVIVAHRYGSTIDGLSYTEKEYDFAIDRGIPVLGFVIAESASWPSSRIEVAAVNEVRRFKSKIQQKLVAFWSSANDLYGKVAISLMKQFAVTPRPGWVRATESIDPSVVNELSRLSEENHRLREDLERVRSEEPLQPPDLDHLVELPFSVYSQSETDKVTLIDEGTAKASWLSILSAIGPELILGGVSERIIKHRILSSALKLTASKGENYQLTGGGMASLRIELMARGIIFVEKLNAAEIVWGLTKPGKAFFLSRRALLLEQRTQALQQEN